MSIQWREKLSVDASFIDNEHKKLIMLVNMFEAAVERKEGAGAVDKILRSLYDYTKEHFQHEEDFQNKVSYPFAAAHKNEHRCLMRRLGEIISLYQERADGQNQNEVLKEVMSLLKDWLIQHIIGSDLKMKPYVENVRKYERNGTQVA